MCNVCQKEASLPSSMKMPTNKGIEIETILVKNGIYNWQLPRGRVGRDRLCAERGSVAYDDGTVGGEITTSYTKSYDLLVENITEIFRKAKRRYGFDKVTVTVTDHQASNHIHFSNGGDWSELTKFALELNKHQPFFYFLCQNTPYGSHLSYRNGTNPYNSVSTQENVEYLFHNHNYEACNVTVDKSNSHLEFRLPDAMSHPFMMILTCVFMDAIFLASKKGKTFPHFCRNVSELQEARRTILRKTSEVLHIGNLTIGRTEYIQRVISFYREEIEECLATCSEKLRRCLVQLINLLIDGLCLNIYTVDISDDQRMYLDDHYKFFTRPFQTFRAFKKVFEVPKRKATSLRDLKKEKELKIETDTNYEVIDTIRSNNFHSLKQVRDVLLEKYNHRSEEASLRKVQRMLKKFRITYLNKVFWNDGVHYLYLFKKNEIVGGEY